VGVGKGVSSKKRDPLQREAVLQFQIKKGLVGGSAKQEFGERKSVFRGGGPSGEGFFFGGKRGARGKNCVFQEKGALRVVRY